MDNKIFTVSTGSRISAFLEGEKKKRLEGNTPQCEQWFHCIMLHFVILVMEKFKLIIQQDKCILGQDFI